MLFHLLLFVFYQIKFYLIEIAILAVYLVISSMNELIDWLIGVTWVQSHVVRTVMQVSIQLSDLVPRFHTSAVLISSLRMAQCMAFTQCATLPLVNSCFHFMCVCVNVYFNFILNCALLICNSPVMILYA